MNLRIGQGFDVHSFATDDRPLVLGGVTIPDAVGLDGHSDADALCHAITDALLGAAARGDLGSRFGVARPELVGADSTTLLADVVTELRRDGWDLVNVDATVIAQQPRLAPHRPAMRQRLADVLELDLGEVSVKATTTDHLGAIGRREGIACLAVVLAVAP